MHKLSIKNNSTGTQATLGLGTNESIKFNADGSVEIPDLNNPDLSKLMGGESGRIVQVKHLTTTGTTTNNGSFINAQGSFFLVTPRLSSSILICEISCSVNVVNVAAANNLARIRIAENVSGLVSPEVVASAQSASGGVGINCPVSIRWAFSQTDGAQRSFVLQILSTISQTVATHGVVCTCLEVS